MKRAVKITTSREGEGSPGRQKGVGQAQDRATGETVSRERPRGLCTTCDHFEGCMLPKDEAGVWHCEEYK